MKKILFCLLTLSTVLLFTACREELDLNRIEPEVSLEMGVALPIGQVTATLGDFLGNGQVRNIFIGEDGVLFYRDTFDISRNFRKVNIEEYASTNDRLFPIHDRLPGITSLYAPIPMQQVLDFEIAPRFDMLNNTNLERVDSIDIVEARFVSTITTENLNGFQWEWVNSVQVELGEQFHRADGNTITVYQKGVNQDITDFNQPITIILDNFMLDLIKDHSKKPSITNVVDSAKMTIRFDVTVPAGQPIPVDDASAFRYNLQLTMMDFNAIWGRFQPSSDMSANEVVNIGEMWNAWNVMQKACLPLNDPQVNLMVTTKIAGNLDLYGSHMFVVSDKNPTDTVWALFNDQHSKHFIFDTPSTTLSVDRATLDDSITNVIYFDKSPERGRIDRMFAIRPDRIGYKFDVNMFNPDGQAPYQVRLGKDNRIGILAEVIAPFKFNEGLELSYIDTIHGINLEAITFDSLLVNQEIVKDVETAHVYLHLVAQNSLPFELEGRVRLLDANGETVTYVDAQGERKPLEVCENNHLKLAAPVYTYAEGNTNRQPGKTDIAIAVSKEHFDAITTIKEIIFEVGLTDEALRQAAASNAYMQIFPTQITADQTIKLMIGLSADAKATIVIPTDKEEE